MNWIQDLFGTGKPIIAMCHLCALPGDPYYDPEGGMQKVIDFAVKDLRALQDGGVDSIMFSNEFSLPYLTRVKQETPIAMSRVIGEIMSEIKVPFGVDVLWDPISSIDLAAATGAKFIREIMSGVYASDFGIWNTNIGEIFRHKVYMNQKKLKMLFNIVPEAAKYLSNRDIVDIAKSTVFNNKPDALCVSGLVAGLETDTDTIRKVKSVVHNIPIFANTGCTISNIENQLAIADGAVVGTAFKIDGVFENHVDQNRVEEFMEKVREIRKSD